jgi:hypothetical protein
MKLRALALLGIVVTASASADTAVYDLGTNNAKETAEAINNALHAQCGIPTGSENVAIMSKCRADLLPTGQLLVEAPAASQAKIAEVLKAIAARDAAPTPRVTLQSWVLSGMAGRPDSVDPALRPLSAVLQQLERLHGELGFAIEDSATLVSQSGTVGLSGGGPFSVTQNVRANGNDLSGGLRISFQRPPTAQNLSLEVSMKRGEYLVLGERTFSVEDETAVSKTRRGTLFYIVHWPEG